jgi:hypothetical protein
MIVDLKTIKKIYINLDRDVQRKNKFEKILNELNYSNYERFSARQLKKIKAFNHGCSQSHYDLMLQYKNDLPLLVFEDDVKPTKWYGEYVTGGKIEVPDDADTIYLGYSTGGNWETIGVDFSGIYFNENWFRLKHGLATHAILFLNNSINVFIENAKNTIENKIPIDVGYAKDVLPFLNVYAPTKALFYQWDKCWPTTNVVVEPNLKRWISYKENGSLNFMRNYHD